MRPQTTEPSTRPALGHLLVLLGVLLMLPILLGCGEKDKTSVQTLRLATTTSTRDTGLLDELLPPFEVEHHVRIDVIAVGTGKALKLGEAGDVDLMLVHAREAEEAFVAAGHGVRRESVMANYFELLGPPDDPAQIRDLEPTEALRKIADAGYRFVSRGDDSGTHKRELKLWQLAGGRSEWDGYIETGQGMGATLVVADQMQAYTLADRGTFLFFRDKIDLVALAARTPHMKNEYGMLTVHPEKHPSVQNELADALVDYFLDPDTQRMIANYQVADEQLFVPVEIQQGK